MAIDVESGQPIAARPTGTVTFLFSDIEGSTARWDADREAMASALARHDAIVRRALESNGAYVFKTIGDAFCAAFHSPDNAVSAAIETQRGLAAEDFSAVQGLRVRLALHVGTAQERDGDYFGPALNRVARLLAIGHGGQVLISGAAAELLTDHLPAQTALRTLGEHRLKDLSAPEQVYQLVAPQLAEDFPPLRSIEQLTNNLPAQLTSFVGRDEVVAEIDRLLEQHRLVTLTGSGGSGKTRCATAAAASLVDNYENGVWFVDLAPLADATLVPSAIAQVLRVQGQPGRSLIETLVTHLKRKRLLLILDNCEHVIEEVRKVATQILRDCEEIRILATSREPLNVYGEVTYRIPSLTVPPDGKSLLEQGPSQYGAAELFVERAVLSDRRFMLTPQNASSVAELCARLDGIPLAIELAAARVKVLSPQQLVEKLDERFRVLAGGDRSAMPRHRTMRALIDWSFDLLSEAERATFRKISIFAGSFSLESAAAVFGGEDADEFAVLDILASLVDKSLVQAEPSESGTRYRLLESSKQYAGEKLRDAGEYERAARAHARAFLPLAQRLDASFESASEHDWYDAIELDLENFRTALTWAFGTTGDALLGQQLTEALRKIWWVFGWFEGQRWLEMAKACVSADTPVETLAAIDLADANMCAGMHQIAASLPPGERALARYIALGDNARIADAKYRVGDTLVALGRTEEGEALLREALAEKRAMGAGKLVGLILQMLAQLRETEEKFSEARSLYAEARAIARASGAERVVATVAINLAETEFHSGDFEAALASAAEALEIMRSYHNEHAVATIQCNVAAYLIAMRRFDEAAEAARAALLGARETEFSALHLWALQRLAAIAALRSSDGPAKDDLRQAARLQGYVDGGIAALGVPRDYTEQREYDATIAVLREALGEEQLAKLMIEGRTWSEAQADAAALI